MGRIIAAGATGVSTTTSGRTSREFDGVAGCVATPLLEQVEALQRGLVAGDEQDGRVFGIAIGMLEPGTAWHCQIVKCIPLEPLAVDDRVSLALEWCDQQACGLPHRERLFARAQHLNEKRHSLEYRTAGQRVDILDRDRLIGNRVNNYEPASIPHRLQVHFLTPAFHGILQ